MLINRLLFYVEEYKSSAIAILISLILVATYGFFAFMEREAGVETHRTIEATIINYARTRSSSGLFNYVFIATLDNGQKVKIDDTGIIPKSYRGAIYLDVKKGEVTGRNIYTINQKPTNNIKDKSKSD